MSARVISFCLNGRAIKLLTDPNKRLLSILREDFGLTGAKQGCSEGVCGACTVLLDGQPVNSCILPVSRIEGKHVTTIEGIGSAMFPDPVQVAFVKVGATQCGFCTPGMILNAKYILDKVAEPTEEAIRKLLSRNLCRCTGYQKIVEAILLAKEYTTNLDRLESDLRELRNLDELRIGGRIPALNSWEKVLGSLQFVDDIIATDVGHAKVLRSPHYHAKIKNINTKEAEAIPGVVCVATSRDIKGTNRLQYMRSDWRLLADDKVRYFGEPVAVVVAATEDIALEAISKIQVSYEILPSLTDMFEAIKPGVPLIQDECPGNVLYAQNLVKGDVDKGFNEADVIEENIYVTSGNAHAYLEPDTGVGYVDEEGRITLYAPGQGPHYHQTEIAKALGLDPGCLRVVERASGGGFGGRIDPFMHVLLAVAVYKAQRPVKLRFTMEDTFMGTSKRHPTHIKLKTGVKNDGRIVAHEAEIYSDAGAYALGSPGVLMRQVAHISGPYDIPNIKVVGKTILTNNTPCSSMRGFGVTQTTFAVETQINKIALKLGLDPLDFRKINCLKQGSITATGQVIEEPPGLLESIQALENHRAKQAKPITNENNLSPGIRRGRGYAIHWYGIGKTGLPNKSVVSAEVCQDGGVLIRLGGTDMGQGTITTISVIAANEMNVPLSAISTICSDSLITPDCDITAGSKHTFYTGNATIIGCRFLKDKIRFSASEELGVHVDQLEIANGFVYSKTEPERRISWADLRAKGYDLMAIGEAEVAMDVPDPNTGQGSLYEVFTFGAGMVDAEVNTVTGKIKVVNVVQGIQCGRAINRLGIEAQVEGGVAMGIGFALLEKYVTGKTRGFKDYKIAKSTDVPNVTTYIIEVPQSGGRLGAVGMGETPHFPIAPAIAAALYEACGVWAHNLPINPSTVIINQK